MEQNDGREEPTFAPVPGGGAARRQRTDPLRAGGPRANAQPADPAASEREATEGPDGQEARMMENTRAHQVFTRNPVSALVPLI